LKKKKIERLEKKLIGKRHFWSVYNVNIVVWRFAKKWKSTDSQEEKEKVNLPYLDER
jgi:hypothetical protein